MSLRVALNRTFEDPISQDMMHSPIVITKCGHTFQDATIRQWIGQLPSRACPTCDRPVAVADLVRNHVVEDAVEVLNTPPPQGALVRSVMRVKEVLANNGPAIFWAVLVGGQVTRALMCKEPVGKIKIKTEMPSEFLSSDMCKGLIEIGTSMGTNITGDILAETFKILHCK